jgi:hypothetical protein
MGYGARARRAPAIGSGQLTDVDIYKIGILGKCERGLADLQEGIYNDDDFFRAAGGYNTSYYASYVMKSFYNTLNPSINCEMKVKMHVASDAVQAGYDINDGLAAKIFDIDAGRKSKIDKSAFGNKIAIKIAQQENITFKLTIDTGATPTTASLDQVNNLQVGYYVQFADGTNTEVAVITAIDTVTKQITFAALTNAYTSALTTVSRLDWDLQIAVKDSKGVYQLREEWLGYPFAQSDTLGMALAVNDAITGSDYVILAVDATNASAAASQRPAALTTWTPFTAGSDGTSPTDSDWNTLVTGMADSGVFILLAPESTSADHNGNMTDYATSGIKFLYFAQAANGANEASLKNFGAQIRSSIRFGMLASDKWMETDDPTVSEGKIDIPKVGYDAAHFFNNYNLHGEGKVAAGNKDTLATSDRLLDSNGLVHDDVGGKGGRLIREYSVNICRFRPGKGITNNSARTFSTDDGYKFQNQLVMFLLFKRSIVTYLQTIEQDSAGTKAQETHRNAVWSYMRNKFEAGVFYQGEKEDGSQTTFADVVIIVNDFSNNTLADINNGIENTFVQFVAAPPIEEPILSLASAGVTTVKG